MQCPEYKHQQVEKEEIDKDKNNDMECSREADELEMKSAKGTGEISEGGEISEVPKEGKKWKTRTRTRIDAKRE